MVEHRKCPCAVVDIAADCLRGQASLDSPSAGCLHVPGRAVACAQPLIAASGLLLTPNAISSRNSLFVLNFTRFPKPLLYLNSLPARPSLSLVSFLFIHDSWAGASLF